MKQKNLCKNVNTASRRNLANKTLLRESVRERERGGDERHEACTYQNKVLQKEGLSSSS